MKIYVANLQKDELRRQSISSQLEALGLDFEVVEGVDGRVMTRSMLSQACQSPTYFESAYQRTMVPAEIGCVLSHQLMYKKFLASNDSYAVFLEDDAMLLDGFEMVIDALAQYKYDFVLLGYPARTPFEVRYASWIEPIYRKASVCTGFVVGESPRKKCFGMVGVFLSRQAAAQLVEINSPITTIADDHPLFKRYLEIMHLRPLVVTENLRLQSSIHQRFRRSINSLSGRKKLSRLFKGVIARLYILVLISLRR